MSGRKMTNQYAQALASYARIPKAVLAAVAYAFAVRLIEGHDPAVVESAILREWQVLHDNGIVDQEPK